MPNEAAIRARHSGAAANIQRRDAPAAEAYRISKESQGKIVVCVINVINENNVSNANNGPNANNGSNVNIALDFQNITPAYRVTGHSEKKQVLFFYMFFLCYLSSIKPNRFPGKE